MRRGRCLAAQFGDDSNALRRVKFRVHRFVGTCVLAVANLQPSERHSTFADGHRASRKHGNGRRSKRAADDTFHRDQSPPEPDVEFHVDCDGDRQEAVQRTKL